jgi:hypothetical protein
MTESILNLNKSSLQIYVQADSRVIMSLTKFVMQPTIHVPNSFVICVFIHYST